jgi:hypothetical protein
MPTRAEPTNFPVVYPVTSEPRRRTPNRWATGAMEVLPLHLESVITIKHLNPYGFHGRRQRRVGLAVKPLAAHERAGVAGDVDFGPRARIGRCRRSDTSCRLAPYGLALTPSVGNYPSDRRRKHCRTVDPDPPISFKDNPPGNFHNRALARYLNRPLQTITERPPSPAIPPPPVSTASHRSCSRG